MLRHLPKFQYNGFTIIMSNPSRFDKTDLLSGTGGYYFNQECLAPDTNRWCCDIRLVDDRSPLILNTKVVLLLGQRALTLFTGATTTLGEQRGSHLMVGNIPCVPSFLPQDAMDIQNFEKRFNPEAEGYDESDEETEKHTYIAEKAKARTARENWRFWLRTDTKKAIRILDNNGVVPASPYKPRYHIYPSSDEVISILTETKGKDLYVDIETDFISTDMRCFAFSFGSNSNGIVDIYVVPTLDINYKPAYGQLPFIIRALAVAMRDNCIVSHNGAVFDWFVFAWKYHIPIGKKCFDTMVAQHRIYPMVEKSLGHCVSLWTYEQYHKSEAVHTYKTEDQARKLYEYCGKDVFTMFLVKEAQLAYAEKIPGLRQSIEQAQKSLRPYLITSLMGIKYLEAKRKLWIENNNKLIAQYFRIMKILTGPKVEALISNQKCVRYFHDQLGYAPVARSKRTNKPSLDEKALLKLKLKHHNPVIDFLLAFRAKQKEVGTLSFEPWRTDPCQSQQEDHSGIS